MLIFCSLFLQMVFAVLLALPSALLAGGVSPGEAGGIGLVASIMSAIVTLGLVAFTLTGLRAGHRQLCLRVVPVAQMLGCWRCIAAGALAYGGVLLFVSSLSVTFRLQPSPQEIASQVAGASSPWFLALACVVTMISAPMVEEVLFRGMLYLPLRRKFGVTPAAITVSIIFSAIHRHPWGLGQFFVLSLVLVALVEKTRSLWPAVVVHSLYNGANLLLLRL